MGEWLENSPSGEELLQGTSVQPQKALLPEVLKFTPTRTVHYAIALYKHFKSQNFCCRPQNLSESTRLAPYEAHIALYFVLNCFWVSKMSYITPQTPQRLLPGAFLQTPAHSRYQPASVAQRSHSAAIQNTSTRLQGFNGQHQEKSDPQAQSQPLLPVQHAAKTINKVLQRDASFPDLDGYIKRNIFLSYSWRKYADIL